MQKSNLGPLLLIARPQSYRIAPYIQAAKAMGLDIILASNSEHSLTSEVHDGIFVDLDNYPSALNTLITEAKQFYFCGVLGCDDSTVELAADVAKHLGLIHNPPHAARLSRRKDLSRAHLLEHHCAVPQHSYLDIRLDLNAQIKDIKYPCVLKPVHLSASRGVIRTNNSAELLSACERIRAIIESANDPIEASRVLVEDYIEGDEVAYEGYLFKGELNTLAIFDKPHPLQGPFFEESIYVTPSQLSQADQKRIKDSVAQACQAYGLQSGPIHAEVRINDENAWILEVASRTIGGECGRTLDTSAESGISIEHLAISLAIGQPIEPQVPKTSRGVMMIPIPKAGILKAVDGIDEAEQVEYIDEVKIIMSPGHELVPTPEGEQYPGYIFASGPDPKRVSKALEDAHSKLKFNISPLWKIGGKLGKISS